MSGGLVVIREALRARKGNLAVLARDVGVSPMAIESFAQSNADLPVDKIQLIVAEIWHGFLEYNAQADVIQPIPQPPARSIGNRPTWEIDLPKFTLGHLPRGPQLEVPKPKPKQRPGWLGVWE